MRRLMSGFALAAIALLIWNDLSSSHASVIPSLSLE